MGRPANVVELLRDLVAIPSVNPQGDPGTDLTGEQAMAEYVADFLRHLGAEVKIEPVEPDRPNVVASFAPRGKPAARLAFAPHLDTVSVAGMTIPPFDPAIRDEKLWGRGSTDTKGPMAAALWALHEWAKSPARESSRIEWIFLGLMGEESNNDGARALAQHGFRSDLTLVLEPTDFRVVTAHKGVLWMEIHTHGLACHGSTPERGRNAILEMGRVLEIVEKKITPALAKRDHPKLGHSTLNVGTISGGAKINIVPDACRIELDLRVVPGVRAEEIRAEMEAELQRVLEAEVRIQKFSAPLHADESLPWVERVGRHGRGLTTAPWFSDAAFLDGPHCPAVCVGPGLIAQAHTKDEFIRLRDLEEGADFFGRWIAEAEAAVA
jgi:acetylornithine deacetylase/succinyl-diaminopimelate desuccinylase-like protein